MVYDPNYFFLVSSLVWLFFGVVIIAHKFEKVFVEKTMKLTPAPILMFVIVMMLSIFSMFEFLIHV